MSYRTEEYTSKQKSISIHREDVHGDESIEVVRKIEDERKAQEQAKAKKPYSQEDLYYLAQIIWCEAGSDWVSDEHQIATGSVVLNRVKSDIYPNTIKGVVTQKGQYTSYNNKWWKVGYNQRAYDCAKFLLENGSQIPSYVIFQSQGKQGNGVWKKIQNQYFCYLSK